MPGALTFVKGTADFVKELGNTRQSLTKFASDCSGGFEKLSRVSLSHPTNPLSDRANSPGNWSEQLRGKMEVERHRLALK